jgi:elongation factor P
MAVLGHTDLKVGTLVELESTPYRVVDYSHHAMGRGGAVVQVKLKNLLNGSVTEKSFRSSDKISSADVTRSRVQLLYREDDNFNFMDQESYEQTTVSNETLGDQARFIAEGAEVQLLMFQDRVIGLEMPNSVYLNITRTDPGAKGDTATAALKPAVLETGVELMVPLFINESDVIKVDTRTGAYIERKK